MPRLTVISVPILRLADNKVIANISFYGMSLADYFVNGQSYIDAALMRRGMHNNHYAVAQHGTDITAKSAPLPYIKPKVQLIPKPTHDELYDQYVSSFNKRHHGL